MLIAVIGFGFFLVVFGIVGVGASSRQDAMTPVVRYRSHRAWVRPNEARLEDHSRLAVVWVSRGSV